MLYSHLHVVEYDTLKEHGTTHRHLTLSTFIRCLMPSLLVFLWQYPLTFQLEHILYMNNLSDSWCFLRKWWPVRCWSFKPDVDGLPWVSWERSRATKICFITSVQKWAWKFFLCFKCYLGIVNMQQIQKPEKNFLPPLACTVRKCWVLHLLVIAINHTHVLIVHMNYLWMFNRLLSLPM